jgi:hypothetical protein
MFWIKCGYCRKTHIQMPLEQVLWHINNAVIPQCDHCVDAEYQQFKTAEEYLKDKHAGQTEEYTL